MEYSRAIELIIVELESSFHKHPHRGFNSTHEGYGVIKEEFDEMWDAIKVNRIERSCSEAIQVAAMCVLYLMTFSEK